MSDTIGTETDPAAEELVLEGADWYKNYTGPRCNAKRQRGRDGYCQQPAGYGTDHLGKGRCYMHGGRPERVHEAAPYLSETVKKLSVADTEALMSMGTQAMVLARARLVEKLLQPGLSSKETSDLTMSIQRLDNVLSKHPDINDPDAVGNVPDNVDEELARLVALERKTG